MIGLVWRAAFSPKISNLVVGHSQGLCLIGGEGGCVCVYECVCACLRPWEGWLQQAQTCPGDATKPVRNERWWQHRAKKQRRIFTSNSYENKYSPNGHTNAVIYDTAMLIGIFFSCYKICDFYRSSAQRGGRETKSKVLILRKSCIQPLLTQVTHSKQIGGF